MDAKIQLTPSKDKLKINETYTVAVLVTPGSVGIAGLQMDLKYNPASVRIDSVVSGPFLWAENYFNNGTPGVGVIKDIYGVSTRPDAVATAPGVFVVLNCTALAPGKSDFALERVLVGSKEAVALPFVWSANQVLCLSGFDLSGDGSVELSDLELAADRFGLAGEADFDGDGAVSVLDLILVVRNFTL